VQLWRGRGRHHGAAARNKRVPFLLDDNVGAIGSIVGPCEVCAKPAELRLNENSYDNQKTAIIFVNRYKGPTVFVSLFEFVEALHRVHTAKKVTAMQISMRLQQKLDKRCRGYK